MLFLGAVALAANQRGARYCAGDLSDSSTSCRARPPRRADSTSRIDLSSNLHEPVQPTRPQPCCGWSSEALVGSIKPSQVGSVRSLRSNGGHEWATNGARVAMLFAVVALPAFGKRLR